MESRMRTIVDLLEEEVARYEKLVAALKKEAEDLRKGSPEDLQQSVKCISEQVDSIHRIHREARKLIEAFLPAEKGKPEGALAELMRLLPPGESRILQKYNGALERLRNWAMEINSRNRAFIRESLSVWKDLFSLRAPQNAAAPVYARSGKKQAPAQLPISLDRKV